MENKLKILPPDFDIEDKDILKKLVSANRFLAELKGVASTIPNEGILINTLSLQEAKDSSAIENIITTHDELFREDVFPDQSTNASAKEVSRYVSALKKGFDLISKSNLLTTNHIIEIQGELESNRAGIRKLPGTKLKSGQTGETVYVPPQNYEVILRLMGNLEKFINDDTFFEADPLVKMAIIHYQFESIHPFYDGNGRTGRIINALYMVLKGLLNIPILYMSRYIISSKSSYYSLLQGVRDEDKWKEWILYMLDGVEATSRQAIGLINEIQEALLSYKNKIRSKHKFYSHDLLNNLFSHPYTKIEFLQNDLKVSRLTATKYLDTLTEDRLLQKKKIGRSNYYVNTALLTILSENNDKDICNNEG